MKTSHSFRTSSLRIPDARTALMCSSARRRRSLRASPRLEPPSPNSLKKAEILALPVSTDSVSCATRPHRISHSTLRTIAGVCTTRTKRRKQQWGQNCLTVHVAQEVHGLLQAALPQGEAALPQLGQVMSQEDASFGLTVTSTNAKTFACDCYDKLGPATYYQYTGYSPR